VGTAPAHAQSTTYIRSDTVWTLDKSPYIISSTQFIAQGVTLTIEPGVTVKSTINWKGEETIFALLGNLVAVGTADAPITFECNGAQLVDNFGLPSAYFSYCNFNNCPYFWNSGGGGQGHFTLTNSNIEGSWAVMYPSGNVYIQNNVFTNCSVFVFFLLDSSAQVYVQNNIVIKDSANLQRSPYMFVIHNPPFPNGTILNLNNETNMAPDQTIPPPPTSLPTQTSNPQPTPATPQPTQTPTPQPTASPTPTPLLTIVEATTNGGSKINLPISGNVSTAQMTNVTLSTDPSSSITTLSFSLTGQSGSSGFGNITIPKRALANPTASTVPLVLVDGVQTLDQIFTQDATNFYVSYTVHFSTHTVSIVFNPTTTPSPTPTPSPTVQPTLEPSPTPTTNYYSDWVPYAIVAVAVALGASVLVFFKKRKKQRS
jgi:hypothetical protein